jgi:hypothetical protein
VEPAVPVCLVCLDLASYDDREYETDGRPATCPRCNLDAEPSIEVDRDLRLVLPVVPGPGQLPGPSAVVGPLDFGDSETPECARLS